MYFTWCVHISSMCELSRGGKATKISKSYNKFVETAQKGLLYVNQTLQQMNKLITIE